MALDYWARKRLLRHGAVSRIAKRLGVSVSLVSENLSGRRINRAVQRALAREMGVPVREAFPGPEYRSAA